MRLPPSVVWCCGGVNASCGHLSAGSHCTRSPLLRLFAAGSARLALLVAATVGKSLGVMAAKAEYMAATGPDLRAVGGPCNSAQLRNISLCNCLQEVHRSVAGLLGRLPPAAAEALAGPLGALQAAAVEAVAPTFRAMVEGAEETLLQMHSSAAGYTTSGGSRADAAADSSASAAAAAAAAGGVMDTSPYMRGLARQLTHCRLEFLSKFNPSPASPVPSGAPACRLPACARLPGSARLLGGLHADLPAAAAPDACMLPPLPPRCSAVARALVERMAARLLLFAVRHASLLRPLPQAGKLQLAKVRGH